MEENKTTKLPVLFEDEQKKFELACSTAAGLQTINNFGAAFQAVSVVSLLREALTDEVMDKVFMPLMNTKVGFLTDKDPARIKKDGTRPTPYSRDIVRNALIEGICIGLLPTGNQLNIIADRMYPTKEGYTALLRKLNVKYFIEVGYDKSQTQGYAEIPCKISYSFNGEKNAFAIVATVKKDSYSSADQLRGKAERRAKKSLYEYITGCDYGDADETSARVEDAVAEEIENNANQGEPIGVKAEEKAPKAGRGNEQQIMPGF
jgi:hypothetical protein